MELEVGDLSGQIITTSAEVTLNGGLIKELPAQLSTLDTSEKNRKRIGGLIKELPQNPLNSGLGIILICPDLCF